MAWYAILPALIIYSLIGSWINGPNRYCEYSNGEVMVIHIADFCPFYVER